ncbi:hypothetical protein BJ912DRAFT_1145546 [Pholiota molesta]|nr:hypothetical protein BJ912DRAFT_1145546 [Pholiota molesta]
MVAPIILAASLAFAVPAVLAEPLSTGALFARQLPSGFTPGDIPQACVPTCQALSSSLGSGTCSDLSCICTNAIDSDIRSCLDCGLKAGVPNVNQTFIDQTVSGYEQACSSGGFPVSGSASTPTSGTTGSGSSGSGTTAASGTANTAAASSPSAGKSAAVAHSSVSIVGVVFALGLSGLALL